MRGVSLFTDHSSLATVSFQGNFGAIPRRICAGAVGYRGTIGAKCQSYTLLVPKSGRVREQLNGAR